MDQFVLADCNPKMGQGSLTELAGADVLVAGHDHLRLAELAGSVIDLSRLGIAAS